MKRNCFPQLRVVCGLAMLILIAMGSILVVAVRGADTDMYPHGFRQWAHVKSAMLTSAHPAAEAEGGLHHIYANRKAFDGYASGNFADGAVIVYELLETNEKDAVISEGARRRLDIMVKDSGRYAATGGWGFARFMGSNESANVVDATAAASCFQCHGRASGHGYVFSRVR
jgi:hypothetical protein